MRSHACLLAGGTMPATSVNALLHDAIFLRNLTIHTFSTARSRILKRRLDAHRSLGVSFSFTYRGSCGVHHGAYHRHYVDPMLHLEPTAELKRFQHAAVITDFVSGGGSPSTAWFCFESFSPTLAD